MPSAPVLLCLSAVAAPVRDPEAARSVVKEVLSEPAYREHLDSIDVRAQGLEKLFEALRNAFNWVNDLGQGLAGLHVGNPVVFWFVLFILVSLLLLMLWHIAYSLRLALRGAPVHIEAETEREDAGQARFRQLLQEAADLAAGGKFREAIRNLLLAMVARTQETDIRLFAGWTNRELVQHLGLEGADQEKLLSFVQTVDSTWYGEAPATSALYEDSRAAVEAFARSVLSRATKQ